MLKTLSFWCKKKRFKHSSAYWERRYRKGRSSGQGSYGKFSIFKADFLNHFCEEKHIQSVIELGCGDGNQLSLARYPSYTGLDIAPSAVALCTKKFADNPTKQFRVYDPAAFDVQAVPKAELALSLDVLFHVVEDETYRAYLQHLFSLASRYVIILSSNKDEPVTDSVHVRHRLFTEDVARDFGAWELIHTEKNPYPEENFADFYVYQKASAAEVK